MFGCISLIIYHCLTLCTGAREAAFRNIKSIAVCLAEELINAAKGSSNSYAIKKKNELERVAKSNRSSYIFGNVTNVNNEFTNITQIFRKKVKIISDQESQTYSLYCLFHFTI